jgi:hypothetical protein
MLCRLGIRAEEVAAILGPDQRCLLQADEIRPQNTDEPGHGLDALGDVRRQELLPDLRNNAGEVFGILNGAEGIRAGADIHVQGHHVHPAGRLRRQRLVASRCGCSDYRQERGQHQRQRHRFP